jgi:hypothetical protein
VHGRTCLGSCRPLKTPHVSGCAEVQLPTGLILVRFRQHCASWDVGSLGWQDPQNICTGLPQHRWTGITPSLFQLQEWLAVELVRVEAGSLIVSTDVDSIIQGLSSSKQALDGYNLTKFNGVSSDQFRFVL